MKFEPEVLETQYYLERLFGNTKAIELKEYYQTLNQVFEEELVINSSFNKIPAPTKFNPSLNKLEKNNYIYLTDEYKKSIQKNKKYISVPVNPDKIFENIINVLCDKKDFYDYTQVNLKMINDEYINYNINLEKNLEILKKELNPKFKDWLLIFFIRFSNKYTQMFPLDLNNKIHFNYVLKQQILNFLNYIGNEKYLSNKTSPAWWRNHKSIKIDIKQNKEIYIFKGLIEKYPELEKDAELFFMTCHLYFKLSEKYPLLDYV